MQREPSSRRLLVGLAAAAVAAGAITYTVIASRAVLEETESDRAIAESKRRPEERGYFSSTNVNRRSAVHPPPASACHPELAGEVRAIALSLMDEGHHPGAAGRLERILQRDPRCVAAGRLLLRDRGRTALQALERRFASEAEARPGDAAAQLLAAYYHRELGDGDAYRRALERASAADRDQPLLHVAWSYYWAVYADPRSTESQLAELEEEVRVSGDPGAVAGLAGELVRIGDDQAALRWCHRYWQAEPDVRPYGLARACARAAARLGAPEDERLFTGLALEGRTSLVSPACRKADLASGYLAACRPQEALALAEASLSEGCVGPGEAQRRHALLALGRYREATRQPSQGYFGASDRAAHALALAIAGDREDALALSRLDRPGDDAGTSVEGTSAAELGMAQVALVHGLVSAGAARETLELAARCERPTGEADRLSRAAGGYASALALGQARALVDRALAVDPRHPGAWATKVYLLSLDGKLDEAVAEGERALGAGISGHSLLGNLGYAHQQKGDCERAVPLYERARAERPLVPRHHGNLATCLDRLGRHREAAGVRAVLFGGRPERALWALGAGLVVAGLLAFLLLRHLLRRLRPAWFARP